mgnify:FL=1
MRHLISLFIAFALVFTSFASVAQGGKQTVNMPETTNAVPSKYDVLIMMSGHNSAAKTDLLTNFASEHAITLNLFTAKGKSEEQIAKAWQQADLVMLDGINAALSKMMFSKYAYLPKQFPSLRVISLGDLDNPSFNQNIDKTHHDLLGSYFNNAGSHNYRNMMHYLATKVLSNQNDQVAAPIAVPLNGLYHPKYPTLLTDDEDEFFNWLAPKQNQSVIGLAIHRSTVDYEQTQIVDAILAGIEAKGQRALAFFYEGENEPLHYTDLLLDDNNEARIDLMINYRSLHYVAKRRDEFTKIGVPVIHALNYNDGDEKHFEEVLTGVSAALTPFFLVMPEDTGSTDPTIIAANDKGVKVIMKGQLNALVERAVNHANLAVKPNKDKKVAAYIWNYPPGEKNIGAAFLDVPSSLEQIAIAMKAQGYSVDPKTAQQLIDGAGQLLRPYYRSEDASGLIEKNLADHLPVATYLAWFESLPQKIQDQINNRWGSVDENPMVVEHDGVKSFIIPRMEMGNFIVLPQGGRSNDVKDQAKLYHDMKTPVNHGYLAMYIYSRKVFGADAYIHLGTHGSLEWTLGKERGLSIYDSPNLASGNLPTFYPYIIDNVGEAMQAKRRGRATMISHLTPGFAKAGLYADVAKLNDLIANYLILDQGETKRNTQKQIAALALELKMLESMKLSEQEFINDFDANVAALQDNLNELAQQAQPLGVHTFGLLPKDAHLFSTILQMLGEGFTNAAKEYEQQHKMSVPAEQATDRLDVKNLEALDGFQLVKAHLAGQPLADLSEALTTDLATAKRYWDNFNDISETQNLMKALSAQYIPVSYGGDPIRNPEVAPTGRNLIGFNPAKVPSKEAYQAGVKLMEQTISDYHTKHGKYPAKLAYSMWSLETQRHHGALESQVLHALGVKPKWNRQGHVVGTQVIPMEELKRPRIDVVLSATGLYRDAFPNVMLWMAEAIDKVARLKEENNFAYRHANALRQSLIEQGKSLEDADYLSTVRIFSNDSGSYGTGLASATLDSGNWEDDSAMTNTYLKRMGYAYGKDQNRWSDKVSDVDLYSKVLSGTDAVIFSRSTNLYALLTNDDPFQYFGGIGQAVRSIDGKTPEMIVSNLRRKDNVKAQNMETFLDNEMRSRYFHPRWIKAMQESGYAGATAILDRMNNMWGWEVMTPELVKDSQWQEFFDVYIDDKYDLDIKEFFEQSNAHALAQIVERMLEANRKGYWPTDEETLKKMLETYTDLANRYDVVTNNDKFTEFVETQNAGFGLAPLAPAMAVPPAEVQANPAQATQQVTGQKLEQVQKSEPKEKQWTDHIPWIVFIIIFLFGAVRPMVSNENKPKAA